MKEGKKFEEQFKKSIPDTIYWYRLKDDMSGFKGSNNPCDYFIFNKFMYQFELKSHKGKSIPFDNIKKHQEEGLLKASKYIGIFAGLILNFRELNKTYYLPIEEYVKYKKSNERKSIPASFCKDKGILIEQELLRVNYRYNIEKLLGDIYENRRNK